MRISRHVVPIALILLAMPAAAQPPADESGERPPGDPAMKQKLLDAFDTNSDGTIDQTERRAIRRALVESFGGPPEGARGPEGRRGRPDGPPRERGPGDRGSDGPREFGRGPDGPRPRDRGPGGPPGPGRPDGPPRGPNPERLFNVFDENADGSLSKEEFMTLAEFMRSLRGQGPPQWMRRDGRRDFDGPPRGDFERRGRGERGPRGEGRPRPPRGPDGPPGPPPPGDVPSPDADADGSI
jgi:hypothetical protein